jgi:cytidine deaminase
MKLIHRTLQYHVYNSCSELPPADLELLNNAKDAIHGSYAPYSRYHVGAAVKLANGVVFSGSNQENMSFPAGVCAERVALFAASSAHPGVPVVSVAISADSENFDVTEPVPPCGICRQALMEFEIRFHTEIRIILGGQTGEVFVFTGMDALLPLAFQENGLVREQGIDK